MAGVIGDNAVPFCGVFDGGGHTLYFSNTSVNDNYIAPFRYVSGSYDGHAAVHHLNVKTTISSAGYRHLCGLIALTKGYVDVVSCNAEIDISCAASTENTDLYPAGIVSQVSSDGNGTVTVTDCTVTGTITSGGKYAASLVGIIQGRATIQSSVGSVVIRSTVNGDGTHGGLVAVTATNSTTGIYGCVFNGKLLTVGQNDTGNCGGILGWKNATVYITDCLYAPAALADGEREVVAGSGDHPSGTFYRGNAPTLTNCCYIRPLGTPQATQGYAVTEGDYVSVDYGTMTSFYSLPDITVYQNGMFYHGKLYCCEGTSLPLSYAPRADYTFTGFQVNGAPLNGSTLTMPAEDVIVTATYAANEYNITVNYETQHGAVYVHVNDVSGTTAHVGDTVSLQIVPRTGYVQETLTVTDANGDPVPVTNNSFTMPASDVTVTVTFCLGNYAILIDQDIRNGTVSASVNNEPATTAKMGDLVTLTAVPDPGWELDSYQVRDAGEHPVPVQDDHFTMPGVAVIVNATFRPLDLAITIDSQIQHGSVSASGTAGIGAYQNIEFYGGNVSAVGSDGGIWPGEETLLSWTDPTDSIYASSYRNTVTVVNGMSFVTDDEPPVTIPAGPVDDLSVINGRTLTPFGPIETPDLHIYSSISVGTDMVITFSARKSDLTNYEKFWIEVVKHEPDGDVVYRYGEDQAEPLSDLNPNGTVATTWKARFTHIYAKEMGLDVDARLCAQDADGQVYVSPVRSANIRDYLGERLTATNNKIQQRVLAADMLNYGAAAQLFTGFETDHLVNQELTAAQLAKLHQYETTALPAVNKTNTNYRPAGASNILFTSVTLGNEVLLNLTIRLPEGAEGVQVLVKDHETGTVVTTLDTAFLGSTFNAAFSGIGADKMRTEYDLVTLVNGVETGNTRTWSVEAYVGEIRAENKPLKVAMANALLVYGDSAAAYFAAQ